MNIQNHYEHTPKKGKIEQIVILLHGVGSNGQDLISLAPYWSPFVPQALFISPDAPFPCDMTPPGYPNSFQWFSLLDRDPHVLLEGVKNVTPIVERFIDEQLEKHNIKPNRLALVGFSQGTMTSLYVAPRLKSKIGGVLGYSGALLASPEERADDLHKMPIHLIHGQIDDVVPVRAWDFARDVLSQQGFPVTGHTTPGLTHSIDMPGIESGGIFLKKALLG